MLKPSVGRALVAAVAALSIVAALSCGSFVGKPAGVDASQTPRASGSDTPHKQAEPQETIHEGEYTNRTFGYRVLIPADLKGTSSPPPLPQHGFVITLSKENDARLSIDGSFDPLLWDSLEGAFKSSLADLSRKAESANVEGKRPVQLGGHPALEFTIKYSLKGEVKSRMFSQIVSKRKCPGEEPEIVYTVTLDTTEERFPNDRSTLERLIGTWHMLDSCA